MDSIPLKSFEQKCKFPTESFTSILLKAVSIPDIITFHLYFAFIDSSFSTVLSQLVTFLLNMLNFHTELGHFGS